MNEYVLHQILEYHWHMATYRQQQGRVDSNNPAVPVAAEVHIGVRGSGSIGTRIALQLVSPGYQVSGWSRSEHGIEGVDCRSGDDSLDPLLGELYIVVGVLPETSTTRGLANASRFRAMKSGAYFINVGRGSLVNEAALIEALDSGAFVRRHARRLFDRALTRRSPVVALPENYHDTTYCRWIADYCY
jgi:glyoxylate/hydroxypyruvate reductase A